MVKIHKTMEKIKVGDRVEILHFGDDSILPLHYNIGDIVEVESLIGDYLRCISKNNKIWAFDFDMVRRTTKKPSPESQSKKIKQALRKICLSGLVIKSEKIISKVKEEIGTDYVFGDTILRALRQLRQDGEIDYAADKHSREYTFK